MDAFVCNKCFATTDRGKKPFSLTQCGHIYCNGCVWQAEKQCPVCQQADIFSVELQQPTFSKVETFFASLTESLESLHKICGFQTNQTSIMLQRFFEIDKKYEMLKTHYYDLHQNWKAIKGKYCKLKMEFVEQQKKLGSLEMENRTLKSMNRDCTPVNSNTRRSKPSNVPNSRASSYTTSGTAMSHISYNSGGERSILGFRVPQSIGSCGTFDTNSTYSFKPSNKNID